MILLGIYTRTGLTAVTASVVQRNGQTEANVLGIVAGDVFQATAMALCDAHMLRATGLKIFTNDVALLEFLTPPITVKPTAYTTVRGWGRVGYGGNANQWTILRKLFYFNRWQIKPVERLPGTEAILDEYRTSDCYENAVRTGVPGCYARLHEGVWADTRDAGR